MKKLLGSSVVFLILCLTGFIVGEAIVHSLTRKITTEPTPKNEQYSRGANDALMALAMLNAEQELQSTNRTYEQMFQIVCGRLRIEFNDPRSSNYWAK